MQRGWLSGALRPLPLSALAVGALIFCHDFGAIGNVVPEIQEHFGADLDAVQWAITGFSIAIALSVIPAGRLACLGTLAVAHGMSDQYGEHWLATELNQGEPDLEPEELGLRCAWVTRAEFEAMIGDARIVDTSTLAAYALLLMAERRGELDLN